MTARHADTITPPSDAAVRAVLRELAAVGHLPAGCRRRRAAMASKRAMLAEIEAYEASLPGAKP